MKELSALKKSTFVFFFFFLFASCKKESIAFSPHIKEMLVSGSVFDSTNQRGLANAPVRFFWVGPGSTHLVSGHTDAQGKFKIMVTVDTTRFSQEAIAVAVDAPEGFIASNGYRQVLLGASIQEYAEEVSYPRVVMFAMANLLITLRRSKTDYFDEMQSNYEFYEGNKHHLMSFINPVTAPITMSSRTISTAAGIPTRILWTKKLFSGATANFKDSIVCQPNAANEITIEY